MSRVVKRVPFDFDAPLGKVWKGYINPHSDASVQCDECGGSGQSPHARRLQDEWYGKAPFDPASTGSRKFMPGHPIVRARAERNVANDPGFYDSFHGAGGDRGVVIYREARRLADLYNRRWSHHLAQVDVDALVAADRLCDFTRRPLNDEQRAACFPNGWTKEPNGYHPTAAEVNEWSIGGFMGHDSSNCWSCIRARCEREGQPYLCAKCNGECDLWVSTEAKAEYEAWEAEEPPAGDGYQVWETVSEGSPISPVFAHPPALAAWMAVERPDEGTAEQWLAMIMKGDSVGSMVLMDGEFMSGVAAVSRLSVGSSAEVE